MSENPRKSAIYAGDWSACAGKPYQPSNGTEGDMFEGMWCRHCRRDADYDPDIGDGCPILADALCLDLKDEGYPTEWRHDAEGVPECSAWEPLADGLLRATNAADAASDMTKTPSEGVK